jgi:thioredoxin reductase (NADPH)
VAIAAHQAGLDYEVVEKGVLVNSIFHFPRAMTFFTTPDLLEIGGLPFVTPYEKPTQWEALRYYRRVADAFGLRIALGEELREISRDGDALRLVTRLTRSGAERVRRARSVALATGYYDHPNRLGVPGEDLPHVAHYYDEPHPFYRKTVVVVGGKNSAAIAALELHWTGARVTLIHRGSGISDRVKYWIRPNIENRIKSGEIKAYFHSRVTAIHADSIDVQTPDGGITVKNDFVFALTGYRPDLEFLGAIGITLEPESQRPHTNSETFESRRKGIYLAGVIVAGMHTNEIFIENGRFHGQAIARSIASSLS